MIRRISRIFANYENILPLFAFACVIVIIVGLASIPFHFGGYNLYPKKVDRTSPLDPYDRSGLSSTQVSLNSQYPQNSLYSGYVTSYLTPFSRWMKDSTLHLGTTIAAHPGGILDEIQYNTRGLDTVVGLAIFFIAFSIASYLFRRDE